MQVEMIYLCKILQEVFTHSIKGNLIEKRVVGDKTNNAVSTLQAIYGPTEKSDIRVIQLIVELCLRVLCIRFTYTPINHWIPAIFIVVIFILLPSVVGRITDHYHNLCIFFTLDTFGVLFYKHGHLIALG